MAIIPSNTSADNLNKYRHPGQKGIIFAWNGSWDIGNGTFEGGIGYKHWLSNSWAVKSYLAYKKEDIPDVNNYDPVRAKQESFSILVGAEDHFRSRSRLSFFLGGSVQFKTSSLKYRVAFPHGMFAEIDSHKHIWGVQFSLGTEYFINKRISLLGQYQIDLSSTEEWVRNRLDSVSYNLGTSTSLLMLTIYF
jgi:predicted porin